MTKLASLFDHEDEPAKERALAAAEALPEAEDVSLADVKRWLQSWGKPDELLKRLRAFRGRLPPDFKFDRDEANTR